MCEGDSNYHQLTTYGSSLVQLHCLMGSLLARSLACLLARLHVCSLGCASARSIALGWCMLLALMLDDGGECTLRTLMHVLRTSVRLRALMRD